MRICRKCGEEKVETEFYVRTGYMGWTCAKCEAERTKRWKSKNREKCRISEKKQEEKNRFKTALRRSHRSAAKHNYRPCNAIESEIREAFTGVCHNEGCGVPESECTTRLHLDHNHETGEFRGWLCDRCNLAAGLIGESAERLTGLAEYVRHGRVARGCRTRDEV